MVEHDEENRGMEIPLKYTFLDENCVVPTHDRKNFVVDELGQCPPFELIKKGQDCWTLKVRKMLAVSGAIRTPETVKNLHYDVNEGIFHKYRFLYYEDEVKGYMSTIDYKYVTMGYRVFTFGRETREKPKDPSYKGFVVDESCIKPMPNPFLSGDDVRAYVLTEQGIWYVRDNSLYYMDAGLRINIEMLRFGTDEIIEMGIPNEYGFWKSETETITDPFMLVKLKGITQTGKDIEYYCESELEKKAKKGFVFKKSPDGFIDEYELSVEQVTVNAAKLLQLMLEKMKGEPEYPLVE